MSMKRSTYLNNLHSMTDRIAIEDGTANQPIK